MIHFYIYAIILVFAVQLYFNLTSETPENLDTDEDVEREVWWQIFGPIIAICLLSAAGIAVNFIS